MPEFVYLAIGKAVVWMCGATLAVVLISLLYLLAGYIYGAFRYRRLGLLKTGVTRRQTLFLGLIFFWQGFGWRFGLYQVHEGKKIYRFGFSKPVDDD